MDVGWDWIVRSLWAKNPAECAYVDMLDTVTVESGNVDSYLFTNNNGQVCDEALDVGRERACVGVCRGACAYSCTIACSRSRDRPVQGEHVRV